MKKARMRYAEYNTTIWIAAIADRYSREITISNWADNIYVNAMTFHTGEIYQSSF